MSGLKRTLKSRTIIYTLVFDIVCLCIFLYVPVIAIDGFRMLGIGWEWGLDIGLLLFTVVAGEAFKWIKRTLMKPLVNDPPFED